VEQERLHESTLLRIVRLAEPAGLLSSKCPMMKERSRRSLALMEKSLVAAI